MPESPGQELHDYLERLCNLLRGQARAAVADLGLQPVQLEALHYLARCNRYSNTPLAVADYLGSTKGTVSQTLKVLEARGLVRKVKDTKDRRVVRLEPTDQGRAIITRTLPAPILTQAAADLSVPDAETLVPGLRRLLRSIQHANGLRSFAECASCRFNGRMPEGSYCRLTGEALAETDLRLICREHEYPSDGGAA
jgi:DNA-binding MarR family transcriptional regulator